MPAMFGNSGGKLDFPPGTYVAQIRDVEQVEGTDFKDRSRPVPQFKWGIDVKIGNHWVSKTIWTGISFTDLKAVTDPQFVSKLTRLVRACGLPVPQSAAQAEAWNEQDLIGARFGIIVEQDAETGVNQTRFGRLQPAKPPARPQPGNGNSAPQPDPFAEPDPGAAPVGAKSVHGADDDWE